MEKKFDKILSISGVSGLHYMVVNRENGLIVEDIASGKRTFVSTRKHQFTPLISIGIYTQDGEAKEFREVLKLMKTNAEAPPAPTSSEKELSEYFAKVLPDYDRDQVRISDIKKTIKWYGIISKNTDMDAILTDSDEEE